MNELMNVDSGQNVVQKFETAAEVLSAQTKALIEARYIVAMKRPRDLDAVREKLLKDCRRPYFAEVAIYKKPTGGKTIEGASIRFAESAIRAMGNITIDTNVIYDDKVKRIVRVCAGDVESNTTYSIDTTITKTVERKNKKPGDVEISRRINSYNQTVYILEATDDELNTKQNALISKAMRTIGLRLIPGDIIDECLDEVRKTQTLKDKADPDSARKRIFDAFGGIGISVDEIKKYLGHSGTHITPLEMQELRGVYQSLKDNETTWRDVMESVEGKPEAKNKEKNLFEKKDKEDTESKVLEVETVIEKEGSKEPTEHEENIMRIREMIGAENENALEMYLLSSRKINKNEKINDISLELSQHIIKNIDSYKKKAESLKAK